MDDLISRQAAVETVRKAKDKSEAHRLLVQIPSAQPDLNEWCTDCKEYDKERNCCPRWNRVIRQTVEDMKAAQPGWIPCDKGEPDEDMECWVTAKTTDALYRGNFTKRYGERRDKGFITSGGFMWWNTALAWMPIYEPEPYRPEPGTLQGGR